MAAEVNTMQTTKVITGKVRLSFVHLFEPQKNEAGEEVYSVMIVWPKEDNEKVGLPKMTQAIKNVYEVEKSKKLVRADGQPMPLNAVKLPIKDADTDTNSEGMTLAEKYPEFAGHMYMNLNSKQIPGVVDRDGKTKITDGTKVYSGCYARVSMNFYAYTNRGNKGITAGLNNVQFWDNGDYLGGRASAESDFDPLDDEPVTISEPVTQTKVDTTKENDIPDWMK